MTAKKNAGSQTDRPAKRAARRAPKRTAGDAGSAGQQTPAQAAPKLPPLRLERPAAERELFAQAQRHLQQLLGSPQAEAVKQLDDKAGRLTDEFRRELREAEAQVEILLRLADAPWQYAVDYLAANPTSPTTILLLIEAARSAALSDANRDRARKRNADVRAEVLEAWSKRTDREQSKAAFAREWVERLRKTRGVVVTPGTIETRWLKGR